ncbi:PSRC1 protein, partial [Bucorvus abyssinicus]|nr:PSRC1 protein [Bucorvus abyssinicus]
RVPPDVRFVTEESFDFGVLSPSDSQEEEEDEEGAGGAKGGGWSPLSGARLEEMVREATRLAAQLERCHLPPPDPPGP